MSTKRHTGKSAGGPLRLSKARLDELVEEALVDAYGESEQVTGFYTMMENDLRLPFETEILGMDCFPYGISNAFFWEYRIIQTPTLIAIIDGGFSPPRQIYMDGREHPKDFNPSWMGHSVGHWEGDTLAIDTVGFNDLGWIGGGDFHRWPLGFPTTEKLRITERFRRLDLGRLEVQTTYDDPSEFKKAFTMRSSFAGAEGRGCPGVPARILY